MKKRLWVLGSLVCALAMLCACGKDGGAPSAPASPALASEPTASVYNAPYVEPSLVPTVAPTVAPEQSPAWATAYIETVNALAQMDPELTYDLIYVDDDNVPELVADMTGCSTYLYTYAGGQVYTLMDGWGYGAMGNTGYEYAPRANAIANSNADFAGALRYVTYLKIGAGYQLEEYYDQALTMRFFDDRNGNGFPDEDEMLDDPIYCYGDQVITEAEFDAYAIPGTYDFIHGTMDQSQILAALENP